MNFLVQRSELRDLYDKVAAGQRISEADALRLFESKDLNAVGAIADLARQSRPGGAGNHASYIINRYINYSNYCILSCQFCSFARKKRDADGFQFTVEEIVQKARKALDLGITELHIVGGLHPSLSFSFYTDMLKALRALDPRLQLKCFTAIEVLHLAWLARKSVEETLRELKAAGLDSLTGDNFDHITAYWVGMGLKLAQVALSYGADDLHGTIIEEHIFHMAGAKSPQLQTEAEMVKAIQEAGRTPVQRNTFYEPIKVWKPSPSATEAEPPPNKSKVLEDNLATA